MHFIIVLYLLPLHMNKKDELTLHCNLTKKDKFSYFIFCFVGYDTQVIRMSSQKTYLFEFVRIEEMFFDNIIPKRIHNFDN